MTYNQRTQASRPAETAPEVRQTAGRETEAQRTEASARTSSQPSLSGPETTGNWNWAATQPGVNAGPGETEGSIQSASTQIARAYGSGPVSPSDIRNASEAYRNEAGARDQAAQQQQGGGTRTLDIFA
jgi:hypothetical protein